MASSNINISSVRLSSRRSGEPFSSLVVVDGYYHCFFCDLMTEFEKKGAAAPGLKCGPCGVEGIMYRGCWIRNVAVSTVSYFASIILTSSLEGFIVDTERSRTLLWLSKSLYQF